MWNRRMPGRYGNNVAGTGAVQAARGIGAAQFTRRADSGSCGLSVWCGRYGFGTADGGIGRPPSQGRVKGGELDRPERRPLDE